MTKRISAIILSVLMIFGITACTENDKSEKRRVSVWVLSEDYADYIKWAVDNCSTDKDLAIEITCVDADSIEGLIEDSRCKGNLPDTIMLTPDKIEVFAKNGIILPLSSVGFEYEENHYYKFAVNTGKVNGKLYGMCWHTSPGLFAYRRSIAEAYLGIDSPEAMEKLITDSDSFLEVAQLLKAASLGETHILAGIDDFATIYWGNDLSNPSRERVAEYFKTVKTLSDEEYIFGARIWSEAWLEGINDSRSIFSYFLSGIAVDDVLRVVSNESSGDWAVTVPYSGYYWGGAYLCICADGSNTTDAVQLLRLLTADEAAMRKISLYSGIFSANINVNEAVSNDPQFELSVLNGQNYFKVLMKSAERISADSSETSDKAIVLSLLNSCAENYISGDYDIDAAIEAFFTSLESFTG